MIFWILISKINERTKIYDNLNSDQNNISKEFFIFFKILGGFHLKIYNWIYLTSLTKYISKSKIIKWNWTRPVCKFSLQCQIFIHVGYNVFYAKYQVPFYYSKSRLGKDFAKYQDITNMIVTKGLVI